MSRPVTRTNRVTLALLGLLLAVGGGLGLALSFGAFGSARATRPVLDPEVDAVTAQHAEWLAPLAALVVVLLGLLALRWLLAQVRTDRLRTVEVDSGPGGRTRLVARGLTDAVVAELEGQHGVQRAGARLNGRAADPALDLEVVLDERVDVGAARRRVEGTAVRHAREALGRPDLPVHLHLALAPRVRRQLR